MSEYGCNEPTCGIDTCGDGLPCRCVCHKKPTVPATEEVCSCCKHIHDKIPIKDSPCSCCRRGTYVSGLHMCPNCYKRPVTPQAVPDASKSVLRRLAIQLVEEIANKHYQILREKRNISPMVRETIIAALAEYAKPLVERISELERNSRLYCMYCGTTLVRDREKVIPCECTSKAAEARADSLERDYERNMVIKDCKQCHGSVYIIDSESGGFTVKCHCYQVRCNELRAERDSLQKELDTLKNGQNNK